MKPIKVCFVSLYAYHLFNPKIKSIFGGAELQLYYLATELAKDPRFEISFVTGDFGQPDFEIREGVGIYGFFNFHRGVKYLKTIYEYLRLWMLLKKINADICLQRGAGIITWETASFCKAHGKRFIYMAAHNADVMDKRPSWMPKGIIGYITWEAFKLGLKTADLIIVQHQQQKEDLKNLYSKEGLVRPSAHRINEADTAANKEFILWVARCEEWKQPEVFLELAESFPEEKFVMVCPVSHDVKYFNEIKSCALKLSNLQFIEYVPFSEINTYFLKAKLFINTSKSEGFPNTFIQAAKSRTPILSLNVNPDELLEKYNMGICAYGGLAGLKTGMKDLLKDNRPWQKISENAYRYAINNHDIKKIIEEDKKVILKLINQNVD